MKLNKIFKWGMVVLILVSVALLVWGFVAGFETSTHEALPPTNALLTWAAIMIGIALFCWIVVGLIVSVMNDPNSDLVFWCSMIPFTSPIVMMARIPFGIPTWQVAVSLVVLFISFMLMTWVAARIFRVGVFMHGKKPTWKDLGAWIKMK